MVEVVVVANVGSLKSGQRVLLHSDSPLLRTPYVKPVFPPEATVVQVVTDGKGRVESGGKPESGKGRRNPRGSQGDDLIVAGNEGSRP